MPVPRPRSRRRRGRRARHESVRLPTRQRAMTPRGVATRRARTGARPPRRRTIRPKCTRDLGRTPPRMRRASAPPRPRTRRARPRRPRRLASQLADDPFRLLARERAQRLGLLAAGCAELVEAGRVTVNGEPGQLTTFVQSRDLVGVDGELVAPQRLTYLLLNRPAGVVTTARDPQRRRTVVELVLPEPRVVPVGRLDADTT